MRNEYDGFQIVNQIELLPALLSSKEFDLYRSMKTTVLDPALRNDGGSYCTALTRQGAAGVSAFVLGSIAAMVVLLWQLPACDGQLTLACPCPDGKACNCPEVNIQQLIRRIAFLSGSDFVNKTLLAALQLLNNGTIVPNKCSQDDSGRGSFCAIDFSDLIPVLPLPQIVSCECPQSCAGRCDGNSTYSCSPDSKSNA
ncbi:hypothetical protein AXG93_673s1140 [Marchantia polymorpha subsp. ruderalis]|uniref:Uncharacterized protein n=1 Tax=Marchantia polymorpha subsp. ruderalis TaxID=1480154 RepID=A0A176WII4_MARPO|nr:hypothetical protein AXG93_673s1140 [Marchantia polymorpha subsp. ruderalis]